MGRGHAKNAGNGGRTTYARNRTAGWRRMARKKKTLGEGENKRVDREIGPLSAVSRVSVITVLVFSGVNSCIWPWHLPDPLPPCCFSTLLATALADDAIFQFGNNACQAASFCPRFFLFPLCAQPAVSQDKHVPDTMFGSVFRAWNLFERVIFTPFFLLNIYSYARIKEVVGKSMLIHLVCFFLFKYWTW